MDFQIKYFKNQYESPDWHRDVLLETEKRMADGKEEIIEWNQVKKLLRKEFK